MEKDRRMKNDEKGDPIGLGEMVKLNRMHQVLSDIVVEFGKLQLRMTVAERSLAGVERMFRRLLENRKED